MKKRPGGFNPWFNKGGNFQKQTEKPLFTLKNSNLIDEDDGIEDRPGGSGGAQVTTTDVSFTTDREPGSCVGWKLYFPSINYKDSPDLVRRIKAAEKHFRANDHWYDKAEIEERCILCLPIDNLRSDPNLHHDWPNILDELYLKSTQTLACLGLAMHNIIVQDVEDGEENYQHRKIYTRPTGNLRKPIKLNEAHQTNGELITVTGTVIHMDVVKTSCKMVCFRCSSCSTELVVKQSQKTTSYVYPSSCHRGCPARSRFVELLSSPFSMYQPRQMIRIQESLYVENQEFKTLEVELIQDLVHTVTLGNFITVTGVIKHGLSKKNQKFTNKNEAKRFTSYLKCFNVHNSDRQKISKEVMSLDEQEVIQLTKAQPSPFRLLLHSLCPMIYGREEVKAGLILGLLSGSNFMGKLRSESHILMLGNPGVGKSKLLQACAEASTKGIFVSGPTSTAVGLTASVGKSGVMDAGSLILANGGACCIDEFDKMSSHAHILLESMEQSVVSITKFGVQVNMPSHVVILAAANPIGSYYDKSKTLKENVKISAPLLSRFDLIYQLDDQDKSSDAGFMAHLSNTRFKNQRNISQSFFSSQQSVNKEKLSWIRMQPGENIDAMPMPFLQLYIKYARENSFPTLSDEAKPKIISFFIKLREIAVGCEHINVTYRQLEALIRLSTARARADLSDVVTTEHVTDVINLFKFTMTDIFADESIAGDLSVLKKPKATNCSSLSKPKQLKAFIEHLRDLETNEHSTSDLKDIAKELGIKDFYEIIDKLNHAGELLKTPNGYKVVE